MSQYISLIVWVRYYIIYTWKSLSWLDAPLPPTNPSSMNSRFHKYNFLLEISFQMHWRCHLDATEHAHFYPHRNPTSNLTMIFHSFLPFMYPPISGGTVGKNLPANADDICSIPGSRFPGGGSGNPLQYSCLENPMDRGAWLATVHGTAELHTPDHAMHIQINHPVLLTYF